MGHTQTDRLVVACAGVLYPAGDYPEALRLTRHLVEDVAARKTMGATARAEVERLGWLAAIRRVRDSQYQRAITTYRAHKRSAPGFDSPLRFPPPWWGAEPSTCWPRNGKG